MKLFYHLRTKLRSRRAQSTRQATALAILFNAILLGSSSPTTRAEDGGPKPETKKMTIQPMAESKPSLAIRFIPDPSEDLDGNAAIFYLKAMGFLEQGPARDRLREIQRKAAEQAKAMGRDLGDVPPISYTTTAPKDYPKQEVRDYLDSSLAFQVPILREAQRYRNFSMDRNIRLSDNPIGYLLPEIQAIRDLARTQSIRCRLAIAENRTEDAIQIVGQQLAMSRHLGMDDFLVSSLVGNAVLAMATDDTLYLLEIANCPNLYWAFTQLPNPLLDIEKCISYERQFAYLQIPRLREVDTEPKQETYWNDFLVDFSERTLDLDQAHDGGTVIVSKALGDDRTVSIQKSIDENAPKAAEYLLSRGILTKDKIDFYPRAQLVFLAMKDYYDVRRDDIFKWLHLPYSESHERISELYKQMSEEKLRFGWFTGLASGLMPNIDRYYSGLTRGQQRIAIIKTIEAIRMAGASNGGSLIGSLDEAPVPIPNDPFTGKPFSYQVAGNVAVLSSDFPTNQPVRIELQFAE